ncbi:NAD-dependent epimerase/dehydratase family protein [Myroides injenensis]|uniref:NAD-dependent epimerase/dehydratase family protein n=1 Tax=Myroides injenensis TaxID=1183151 RepID=UPI0002886795|nr:NAD(P)-dependent oxidoreductase [Myroides injenensis]
MTIAIFFGGAGYIGSHLIDHFLSENRFDRIYIYDIQKPQYLKNKSNKIIYLKGDVREKIKLEIKEDFSKKSSWIFNLAAIHREPGHEQHEYFNTNIEGAKNINEYADFIKIENIYFTSSIAPYGRTYEQCTEQSPIYPETPYGISKSLAEQLHQTWLANSPNKKLIVVRPSVIYGPKDPGNILRTIKAIKKGVFMLPNGGEIIKSYGYIYGLAESASFVIDQKKRFILYNYAENPVENLKSMTKTIKKKFNYKKPIFSIPISILVFLAAILQLIFKIIGKKSDIHPVRVKKASFPTNIKPQYLIDNGFIFKYSLPESLDHWKTNSPEDF